MSCKRLFSGMLVTVMAASVPLSFLNGIAFADGGIAIDEHNFPDAGFRFYVSANIADGADYLSDSELDAVKYIDCSSYGIKDLTGIEHFKKLVCGSVCWVPFAPCVKCSLGVLKYIVNGFFSIKFIVN